MRPRSIFVIGGSAGSLEPLTQILKALPDEITLPIAIVLHMMPNQPSQLASLLARQVRRAVVEPEDKTPLAASTIYVAPPNYHMLLERTGTIALSVDEPVNYSRPSIDVLFESAADAFGRHAIGALLSGSNADGAEGLERIAAAGGIALVQAPASAQYPIMPEAGLRALPTAKTFDPSAMEFAIAQLREMPT